MFKSNFYVIKVFRLDGRSGYLTSLDASGSDGPIHHARVTEELNELNLFADSNGNQDYIHSVMTGRDYRTCLRECSISNIVKHEIIKLDISLAKP